MVLWTKPEENPAFMKAVEENRVLTISQPNVGTRKDFGLVGFFPQRNASYLEFPRALKQEPDTKVVGIQYEEVQQGKPSGPLHKPGPERAPGIPLREERSAKAVSEKLTKAQKEQPPQVRAPSKPPKRKRFQAEITWTVKASEILQRIYLTVDATALIGIVFVVVIAGGGFLIYYLRQ